MQGSLGVPVHPACSRVFLRDAFLSGSHDNCSCSLPSGIDTWRLVSTPRPELLLQINTDKGHCQTLSAALLSRNGVSDLTNLKQSSTLFCVFCWIDEADHHHPLFYPKLWRESCPHSSRNVSLTRLPVYLVLFLFRSLILKPGPRACLILVLGSISAGSPPAPAPTEGQWLLLHTAEPLTLSENKAGQEKPPGPACSDCEQRKTLPSGRTCQGEMGVPGRGCPSCHMGSRRQIWNSTVNLETNCAFQKVAFLTQGWLHVKCAPNLTISTFSFGGTF